MQSLNALERTMASITIRNLDAPTKARLRIRAAHRQRSMEEEARNILRAALAEDEPASSDLGAVIGARFRPLGGVELALPAREPMREPPFADDAATKLARKPTDRVADK
jgi:plasmid stability protein